LKKSKKLKRYWREPVDR